MLDYTGHFFKNEENISSQSESIFWATVMLTRLFYHGPHPHLHCPYYTVPTIILYDITIHNIVIFRG